MSDRLHVQVLGPLRLQRAGAPLALGSRLQRRLLTALVIADGAAVSADRLTQVLWGDTPPPAARNSLQSHVARLRTALGDGDLVVTTPAGYALADHGVEVDAAAFKDRVAQAEAALEVDPASVVPSLTEALGWWHGPAFAEFRDDLAREESARYDQLRVDARLLLAEAQRRIGQLSAAIDGFGRLAADEPLREDAVVGHARALAAAGRTADALEAIGRFRRYLADELGLDPSPALSDLELRLLRGEVEAAPQPAAEIPPTAWSAASAPPRLGTPTVGRDDDVARVVAAFEGARIVTLVGPGGVGKSRLATVAVERLRAGGHDGVAWVDLARAVSGDDVRSVVLEALGVSSVDPGDAAAVAAALARFRGTVVLDCCEHVLDRVADLVDAALAHAGPGRMIATSRERLDIPGEQVVAVAPLPVPDPSLATETDPVVALFTDRLIAVGGAPVEPAAAARVAAAVDGLPLAIELAAARAAAIPVDALLARLAGHLDVLAGTARRHGDRQRTLTSVIDWSYELLSERDRTVFRRLSVFAASFRLDDAEAVVADAALPADEIADAMTRLVERSMVMRTGDGRFRLLEPLRWYAADRLARAGDGDATEERHRDVLLAVAADADARVTGPDEADVVAAVEAALPDLRAVHARAVARGDLPTVAALAAHLYRYAYLRGRLDVLAWGTDLADPSAGAEVDEELRLRAVAAAASAAGWRGNDAEAAHLASLYRARIDDPDLSLWARTALAETIGDLAMGQGETEVATRAYERNRELAGAADHPGLLTLATAGLSVAHSFAGDLVEGERLAREAIGPAERSGAPSARSLAHYALGEALADSDPPTALDAFATAIALATPAGARFFEGIARTADVATRGRHGDPDDALARYRTALHVWYDAGADGLVTTTLRNLVILFARIGQDEAVLTLDAALHRFVRRDSYGGEARRLSAARAAATERCPEPTARRALATASTLTRLDEVVRFALAVIDTILGPGGSDGSDSSGSSDGGEAPGGVDGRHEPDPVG